MNTKVAVREEKPVRPIQVDERGTEKNVDERQPRTESLYGDQSDHNEWLGVLTSSGFFV
ncbi:hypothetical protein HZB94_03525 [Candidatus Falkowbacteria bacterium]|nr:hypothetical protein [Candidatus Falkowbacteria bacterium]